MAQPLMNSNRLVAGKGFNDVIGGRYTAAYSSWKHMLERCYKLNSGAIVCKEWLTFSNFKQWYEQMQFLIELQGYNLKTLCIDKDVKCEDGLIYSPETCCFLPQSLNTFFAHCSDRKTKKTGLPQGISFHKQGNHKPYSYRQYVQDGTVKRHYFCTVDEAYSYRLGIRCQQLSLLIDEHEALLKAQAVYSNLVKLCNPESMARLEAINRMVRESTII